MNSFAWILAVALILISVGPSSAVSQWLLQRADDLRKQPGAAADTDED